jgi:hypothetical protein
MTSREHELRIVVEPLELAWLDGRFLADLQTLLGPRHGRLQVTDTQELVQLLRETDPARLADSERPAA